MSVKPWKQVQVERTRAALLEQARAIFGSQGYVNAVLEEVVRRTGMTRGAIYHHFEDKRALFEAVFEGVLAELAPDLAQADDAIATLLERLREGELRQIVLIDGLSVLGRPRWSELMGAYLLEPVRRALEGGAVPPRHLAAVARLLLGALQEAALASADSASTPHKLDDALAWLLRRLTSG